MYRSTSLPDAFLRYLNCLVDDLHRIVHIAQQQYTSRLILEGRFLKALQQSAVQLSRDTRPLINPCLLPDGELMPKLLKAELVQSPQQKKRRCPAQKLEPRCLLIRRKNGKIENRAYLIPHTVVIAGDHSKLI
jgi:hypothetical protein